MKTYGYCLIKNLLFIAAIFVETCLARIYISHCQISLQPQITHSK